MKNLVFQNILLSARFHRPVGIWLLFWPALWGALLAPPQIFFEKWGLVFLLFFGTVFMRAAGCIMNDVFDKDFDKHVQRTKDRPLAAGVITHHNLLVGLFVFLGLSATLLLFFNWFCFYLALFALVLVFFYPLMKRFIPIPQFFLGLTFSYAALFGYTALTNTSPFAYPFKVWLLYWASFFWVVGYDTIYALQDIDDDQKIGIGSAAVFFQKHSYIFVGICYVLCTLFMIWAISPQTLYQYMFLIGWFGFLMWQVWGMKTIHNYAFLFRMNTYGGALIAAALLCRYF